MHMSREPLILEQQMNSFDKKIFHYLELSLMGIVKFSVWLNVPSKYRGFMSLFLLLWVYFQKN